MVAIGVALGVFLGGILLTAVAYRMKRLVPYLTMYVSAVWSDPPTVAFKCLPKTFYNLHVRGVEHALEAS